MSPHNFLTCFFFSRSEAETGFGLKDMGGRRGGAGGAVVEIAVGTMMEKRERARCGCCGCDCFDAVTTGTGTTVDFLPAAIEAHDDDDEDDDGFFDRGTSSSSRSLTSLSTSLLSRTPNGLFFLLYFTLTGE